MNFFIGKHPFTGILGNSGNSQLILLYAFTHSRIQKEPNETTFLYRHIPKMLYSCIGNFPEPLQELHAWLESFSQGRAERLDLLDAYLRKLQDKEKTMETNRNP